jgi:hypothetical protein
MEYYSLGFRRLVRQLVVAGYEFQAPSAHGRFFWTQRAYAGRFTGPQARDWLNAYYDSVERELARRIGAHSIAYWHHIARRFAPTPFESDPDEATTFLSQKHLEAAVLKVGQFTPCAGVGISSELDPADILDGNLAEDGIDVAALRPQVVLRRFAAPDLADFLEVRKLAHEVWLAMACLRCVGKGAVLVVTPDGHIYTDRDKELSALLRSYDNRSTGFEASAAAIVLGRDRGPGRNDHIVLAPVWNVGRVPIPGGEEHPFDLGGPPNFLWGPLDLRQYLHGHRPLSGRFFAEFGFRLETVVLVLYSLLRASVDSWTSFPDSSMALQRAYKMSKDVSDLVNCAFDYLEVAREALALGAGFQPERGEIEAAIRFLTLSETERGSIDIGLGCLMPPIFPWGWNDRLVVDYAWIREWLYWIATHPRIRGGSEDFKGDLLEERVAGEQVIPSAPSRAHDGSEKQIDASYARSGVLVIAECRAIARSGAWERSDPEAVAYRQRKLEKLLSEADEKARWLARHIVGKNFDISPFTHVLPVAVTPFKEYIWSTDARLWIDREGDLPRILTPEELSRLLARDDLPRIAAAHPAAVGVPRPR